MAVKIRLKRMGKIREPHYRIVVADSRKKRDGAVIEQIGQYHPTNEPSYIDVQSERALYWLGVGAQPSTQVAAILRVTGDWQKFKGEEGAEGSLQGRADKVAAEDMIAEADKAAAASRESAQKTESGAEGAETGSGPEGESGAESSEGVDENLEPGSEEPAAGESTEDAEAATTDES